MARSEMDLLNLFRRRPASKPSGGGGRRPPNKKKRASGSPRGGGGAKDTALVLTRQQLYLGTCIVVLVVCLAFTVGLGFGRRGGAPSATGPSLQADTAGWYIKGKLAQMNYSRGVVVNPGRLEAEVHRAFGLPSRMVTVTPRAGNRGYDIYVGPFESKEHAKQFSDLRALEVARVSDGVPFRYAEYVQTRRPGR